MGVPKQRHTKSRRNRRRSHHALKRVQLFSCPNCKELILPHHFCPACGMYAGREVIDVLAKLTKRERKKKEKELAQKEKGAAKEEVSPKKPLSLEELSRK